MRVDGAIDLARTLLGQTRAHSWFIDLLQAGETGTVYLPQPLPVFFIYWTMDVQDGQLRELEDIYTEDAALIEALRRSGSTPHTRAWEAEHQPRRSQ